MPYDANQNQIKGGGQAHEHRGTYDDKHRHQLLTND
jgi:hypothetical protein